MSRSPVEVVAEEKVGDYMDAWLRLARLIQQGRSFSGRERNCLFLNTRGGRFATASAATGFDFDDDARGLAVVDWDHDGDLDVWLSNRTGPRARFLRNDMTRGEHFLALRLIGNPAQKCNRDAIGARVELYLADDKAPKRIKTVVAGDGYLSQSTKWITFGLGPQTKIERLVVRWPGSQQTEEFKGLSVDGRFELVQGTGQARSVARRAAVKPLASAVAQGHPTSETARIPVMSSAKMPEVKYADLDGKPRVLSETPGHVLVNLWGTWCAPCLEELKGLADNEAALRKANLSIVALCIDPVDRSRTFEPAQAKAALDALGYKFSSGAATDAIVEQLDRLEKSLIYRHRPLPVPTSFLFDSRNQLLAIYKGPVEARTLLADLEKLRSGVGRIEDAVIPLAGVWVTDYFQSRNPAAVADVFIEEGHVEQAKNPLVDFLAGDPGLPSRGPSREALARNSAIAQVHKKLGDVQLLLGQPRQAIDEYEKTLEFFPSHQKTRIQLADLLVKRDRVGDAVGHLEYALLQRRDDPEALNNLAWLRATHPEAKHRDGKQAVELATKACAATKFAQPALLDTLAAAHAEAGQFADAVKRADQAIAAAAAAGHKDLAEKIRARRKLYESQKPYHAAP